MEDETIIIDKKDIDVPSPKKNHLCPLIMSIVGYALVAVGLFLALFKKEVIPQSCDSSGVCVDLPSQKTYENLCAPWIGWTLLALGLVLIVVLMAYREVKKRK